MARDEGMTTLEASFLEMETSGVPMHVAGLTIIDGRDPITLPELRALYASRLRRLPRFRQRPVTIAGGLLRGRWTQARLDLDAHIFHHRLHPPGRMRDLYALCSRIHETLLPRDRPLWEAHLIDGIEGGRQASLLKTHHAITDGIAGIEVAEALFDPPDGAPRPALPEMRFSAGSALPGWAAAQSLLGLAFFAAGGPVALPGPFNGAVGPHRQFGAVTLPMDAVRRVKRRLGGSVDDVLVATVAAGLYRYLSDTGHPDIPHALRAMLPVSTRHGHGVHLGNQVSSIFIDLPMQSDDIAQLLPVIAHSKATLRSAHAAAGGTILVEAAGRLPAPLHRSVLQVVSSLPFAHIVLSDVPGPESPLRLLGRPILACLPLMPLTRDIGLSIATISLAGQVGIGVTVDPVLVRDPQRVAGSIARAFGAIEPVRAPRPVRHSTGRRGAAA